MLEFPNNQINSFQLFKRNKWSIEEISNFKKMIEENNLKSSTEFNDCLNTIYEYNLSYNDIDRFNNTLLHKKGIDNFFKEKAKNRNIEDLIKAHSKLLKEKELQIPSEREDDLEIIKRVNNIKTLSQNYVSQIITKENITPELKSKEDDLIAIINNVIKEVKGYSLRDSQIYSLIILLNKKNNRGKIAQILTGEGKTIIINCLAIILVLKGHKVDIVTSNPILANRDAKESEELYKKFGITVGSNVDKKRLINYYKESYEKECYSKDIVYGTTFEYQGDILRDEYNLKNVRNKRPFDIVIVDEIDSMLIDGYASRTFLSTSKPFIEKYSIFLQLIWFYYKKLNLDDEEIILDYEIIDRLKKYLCNKIIKIINSNDANSNFYFPMSSFQKKFALNQVENWVNSLIRSLKMKKDEEYIIDKNGVIIPVDKDNTGVIQKSTTYSYGLQQFLQMKNDLPITPINLITNYLSNIGFFKRYIKSNGNFVYGMTGTLGSKHSRELLEKVYNLDFDYIPPNSPRILRELTSCICFDTSKWIEHIKRIVKRETDGNRGILLICENIDSVNNIYNEINNKYPYLNLIKIIGEDNEEELIPSKMKPKTVIISTNISGRGTDIKLGKKILKKGGLHIIITFIPKNSRVEEQNYGRAGRKGEPGTWQLVLNYQYTIQKFYSKCFDLDSYYKNYIYFCQNENMINYIKNTYDLFSIEFIREERDKKESLMLSHAMKHIKKVEIEDQLFNVYCKMIEEREELRNPDNTIYLESIEERWAIFLYNLNITDETWDEVKIKFDEFKTEVMNDYDNERVINNPGFYNKYVNEQLSLFCEEEKENCIAYEIIEGVINFKTTLKKIFKREEKIFGIQKFIEKCNLSIEYDENSFIPYFLRSLCKILNKENGQNDLERALENIQKEIKGYLRLIIFILKSFKINMSFIYYQIIILSNIQEYIIIQNLENYIKFNGNVKINKKKLKEVFEFSNNIDKEKNSYLEDCFDKICNNGLENVFFFSEKASFWKIGFMILSGICLIALSFIGFGFLDKFGIIGKILKEIGIEPLVKKLGKNFILNGLDDLIKGEHDRFYPDSDDVVFNEFLKERKKIRKFKEFKLDDIFNKYDHDYENKKNKEDEVMFKIELLKKIKKIGLNDKYFSDEDENENETEETFSENEENEENENNSNLNLPNPPPPVNCYKNEINNKKNQKLEKKINELKNNLDENGRKALIINSLLRFSGKDFLSNSNEGENLNDKIEIVLKMYGDKYLDLFLSNVILNLINKEIEKDFQIYKEKQNNYLNKKKIYINKEKSITKKNKEEMNKIKEVFEEINNNYMNNEEKRKILNEKNEKLIKCSNDLKNLDNELSNLKEILKKIDEKSQIGKNLKDKIKIYFNKNEIIIVLNENKNIQEIENIIKEIEKGINILYQNELTKIAKNEIREKKNKKLKEKMFQINNKILKIINEKNLIWDNCFNNFNSNDYLYNFDDMEKIIKFHIKKYPNFNNNYYYISDFDTIKNIINAKIALKNGKIIIGNFCSNNFWDCFFIIKNNFSYLFLYKSSKGKIPNKNLLNKIKKITNNDFIIKINKNIENKTNNFSEIDSIENIKIIIDQIQNDKFNFIKNFDNFNGFYKNDQKIKLEKKQIEFPENYIKSYYDDLKIRNNNSSRISLGLFKYFFFNENKQIKKDFYDKIYDILNNYDQINEDEKKILEQEFNDLNHIYYKNNNNVNLSLLYNDDNKKNNNDNSQLNNENKEKEIEENENNENEKKEYENKENENEKIKIEEIEIEENENNENKNRENEYKENENEENSNKKENEKKEEEKNSKLTVENRQTNRKSTCNILNNEMKDIKENKNLSFCEKICICFRNFLKKFDNNN